MGWQDRDYNNQLHHGGNPFAHPLLKLILGSLPLGTWFNIRVRIHASLLWYVSVTMIFSGKSWQLSLVSCAALFFIILLHEFGHAIACRIVGGEADDILLWLLGGLAFCRPPRRPWPTFVTVAGGPFVNVLICAITGILMFTVYDCAPPLNPLFSFIPSAAADYFQHQPHLFSFYYETRLGPYLFWTYETSWALLIFNLLPMFPLDGGQMLQAILWKPLGHNRSMLFCCYLGMTLSVLMAILAIFTSTFLLILAAYSFYTCYQQLRFLNATLGEVETEPYDLSAAWEHPDRPAPRKKAKKRWSNAARKRALAEQAEQAQIDAILAKVKEKGLHSLTWFEKRALRKATERQRQRDLAERM